MERCLNCDSRYCGDICQDVIGNLYVVYRGWLPWVEAFDLYLKGATVDCLSRPGYLGGTSGVKDRRLAERFHGDIDDVILRMGALRWHLHEQRKAA